MDTKVGQLYATPWKSLIIKNIEEKHRPLWNYALNKHHINVRHASNELNWQVEDTNEEGLTIKHFIIRQFDKEDVRTFGLCLAIKTQPNSGLFGSVIVRKQFNLIRGKLKSLDKYDILYTEDFNPNSKNYILYRTGIQKEHLAIYLISLFKLYYDLQCTKVVMEIQDFKNEDEHPGKNIEKVVHECRHCGTVYDEEVGEPECNILPGLSFSALPDDYRCPLCESDKTDFLPIQMSSLLLQSV
jgi:rubredoxin